jgi:OOP family OmpA-OmpF porin
VIALRWSWTFALLACRPASPPAEPAAPPPPVAADTEEPVEAPPEPAASAPNEPVGEPTPVAGPVAYTIEDNRLALPKPLVFAEGQAVLVRGSEDALEHIRGYLAAKDYVTTMRIEAHVVGPDAQALSERRALAVAKWLVAHGVDCKRVLPVGFGENKPIADNSSPEGRAQNTRVEAVNAALRGRPIGGMPLDGAGNPAGDPCQ